MVSQPDVGGDPGLRWQYAIVTRYGPLGLILLRVAMIIYALVGKESEAVIIALLTLGVVSVVAGVLLPRAEGEFSASREGVKSNLLSVTQLDSRRFAIVGPALASDSKIHKMRVGPPIMIGDVWDELDANGFVEVESAAGSRYVQDRHGRELVLLGRGHGEGLAASYELIAQVHALGLSPVASGKYPSDEWRRSVGSTQDQ